MKYRNVNRYEHGFGMLELSITLVMTGLFVVGLWTLSRAMQQKDKMEHANTILSRADEALVAYGFQMGRLPCPAPDPNGHAQPVCASGSSGFVPWADLALPDADAGRIGYVISPNMSANNLAVDNTGQLRLLVSSSSTQPSATQVAPAQVEMGGVNISSPAPYFGICTVLTSLISPGGTAYSLQMPSAGLPVLTPSLRTAADSSQTLTRSSAQLSADIGCPSQLASGARALFNTVLSAQVLNAGLISYDALLQVEEAQTADDLENNVIPLTITGPAKVQAKLMNVDMANANCVGQNPLSSCADVPLAYVDLATESVYEAANAIKMVRFVMNEINAASADYILSQEIIATLAIEIHQIQLHAAWNIDDGIDI